ncbi:MAG: S8 family serine peptidase [Ardenticatenaceae bacterium]|nr:S8 family serine peptidase [Ardenticatenaceae bacterium]
MSDASRPAWSAAFAPDAIQSLPLAGPLAAINREWAWGGSTGKGVRVAIIDSGIEHDHPAVGGRVIDGIAIEYDRTAPDSVRYTPEPQPQDMYGHGTACAGIIHDIAPDAELVSVRVLGRDGRGKSLQFAAGINWAIENGIKVINMSLSTSSEEYYALFHRLADEAYFKGVALVAAVNNIPAPSYPSLYSSVFSVAAHEVQDPFTYYYNPAPPVEFGAYGIDVKIAWTNKGYMTSTGNSFATPHMTGLITLIRAKHPELTPFQLKTILYACASNAG